MRAALPKLSFVILWCALICQAAPAQDFAEGPLKPRRSEPKERWQVQKIRGEVSTILEDHQGFLWLGTGDGLVRYDGYRFTTFRPIPGDSTSIGSSIIFAVNEDAAGNIWIGGTTDRAWVSRFDRRTESFIRYRPRVNGLNNSFRAVTALYSSPDDQSSIWIGAFNMEDPQMLSLLNVANGAFTDDPFKTENFSASPFRSYSIIEDASGAIWTGGLGLNRIEPVEGTSTDQSAYTFTSFIPEADTGYRETAGEINHITRVYPSSVNPGVLWAGGPRGLRRFDLATETFDAFFPFSDEHNAYFVPLVEDREGTLWVGTGNGLFTLDRETGRFIRFEPLADAGNITAILEDRLGVLWVGTDAGLFKLERLVNPFTVLFAAPDASEETGQFHVIYSDREDMLWIAKGDTLMRIDRDTGEITRYVFQSDIPSDQGSLFSSIYEDRSGTLWIPFAGCVANGFGGLVSFDRSTGRFTHYWYDPDDPNSISSTCPIALLEDRHGNLWIATLGGGLNLLDRQTGRFIRYRHDPKDPNSLVSDELSSIYEDRSGTIWLGAVKGMSRFDPSTVAGSLSSPDIPAIVFTNYEDEGLVFVSMIEDRKGRFWVPANGEGLHLFDRETGQISVTFTAEDGLASVSFWSVREDDRGMLWLVTAGGLSRFDPENRTVLNFTVDNGLPFRNLATTSQSGRGEFFYGGEEGVFSFFPDQLEGNPLPPEVHLVGLRIGGAPAEIGPGAPLEASIGMTEAVTLPHDQNDLTFEYTGLYSIDQEHVKYRYRLENYDTGWVDAGVQRSARYPRLPPGDYVFRVNAASNEGVWNEEPASVRVTIRPPWWRTTGMFVVYGLLFAVGVYGVDRFQRKRLIAKEWEKTRERELAQAREIEKAHKELQQTHEYLKATQAQLIQQEKLASLGQLTAGIAHEIKNPLNFVNNFAEINEELSKELLTDLEAASSFDAEHLRDVLTSLKINASQIAKHGKRADRIVASMMEHASNDKSERYELAVNPFVEEFVSITYNSLQARLPDLNVTIEKDLAGDAGSLTFSPQDMGRVLQNILSNAFEAVHEKAIQADGDYKPEVEVSTRRENGQVEIRVSDNGPGIPDRVRERVFEPFFTTKPTGSGTGLGLSLSYDIVTQGHGGSLEVASEEGKGAMFIIILPG